jgi:hypothetical protein
MDAPTQLPGTPPRSRRRSAAFAAGALAVVTFAVAVSVAAFDTSPPQDAAPTPAGDVPASSISPVMGPAGGSGEGPSSPSSGASLVTLDGVGYGHRNLVTPTLAKLGVACPTTPEPSAAVSDLAPDADKVDGNLAPVVALTGVEREVFDCLRQCLPTDSGQWSGEALEASRNCMASTAVELTVAVGLAQTWDAIHVLLEGWPQVSYMCHLAGHYAGRAAVERAGMAPAEALRVVGEDCIAGALHGILDAFGDSNPSMADFVDPVRACVETNSGGCADGMGHAAWSATRDYGAAAEVCGMFDDAFFRHTCDGGVIMRLYEAGDMGLPLPGVPDFVGYEAWLDRVVELCGSYSAANRRARAEYPGLGCYVSSPYLLWHPVAVAASEFAGDLDQIAELDRRVRQIAQACDAMGPSGVDPCQANHGSYAASVASYDLVRAGELCRMLQLSPVHERACVAQATDLVERSMSSSR